MKPLPSLVTRVPRTCVWEITTACNLRCRHCEVSAGSPRTGELDTDALLRIADELVAAGCIDVSLTGGEPLLRRDWPVLARRLADQKVLVKVVTNGLLLDDRVIAEMIESGVGGVAVSIDGSRDVHDWVRQPPAAMGSRYDRAIAAVQNLARSPLRTAVITQIHRRNLTELESIYETLVALGVEAWQVQLAFPLGRLLACEEPMLIDPGGLAELHERLAVLARDGRVRLMVADNIGYYTRQEPVIRRAVGGMCTFFTGCMAGCLAVCVQSDGSVKGCPTHPDCFTVGDLRRESFAEIWNDEARFAYNTRWEDGRLLGACAECSFRSICRAGCTSMAYAVTGTIYDNPYCAQRTR